MTKHLAVHFSSQTDDWATPQDLFDKLDEEFNFDLDPCASEKNAKCAEFFTKEQDGLAQSWEGRRVFCNPPYGRVIRQWIEKCATGGATIAVALIPARTDTSWWHDFIQDKAEVRFIRGRVKFGDGKQGAPFPSAIVVFKSKSV